MALGASRQRVIAAIFRRPLLHVGLGIICGTAIIFTVAMLAKATEFPGSESGLSLGALGVSLARGPLALELSLTEERLAAVNRIVNLGQSAVPVDTPGVPPSGSNAIRVSSGGGLWRGVRGAGVKA